MRAGPGVAPGEARRRPHASVRETEGPLRPGRRRPPHSPRRHFRRIRKGTPAGPAPPSTPPVLSGHDPAARPPPRLARRPNARARAPRTLTGRAAGAGEAAAEVTTAPGSPNTAARRWGRAGGAGRGRAERQGCQVRQVRRRVLSAPRVVTAYPGPPGAWMERRPGSPEAFSGATRVSLCLSPERCPPWHVGLSRTAQSRPRSSWVCRGPSYPTRVNRTPGNRQITQMLWNPGLPPRSSLGERKGLG